MPRRKDPEPEPFSLFGEETPDELEEAFDFLPADQKAIHLFRVLPQGRPPFLDKLSLEELDLNIIRERYGGGKYLVVARDKKEGRRVEKTFVIEGEPIVRSVKEIVQGGEKGKGWMNPSDPSDRLGRLELLVEKLAERENGGQLATIVAPIISRMVESSTNSEDKLLEKLALFKSLFAPAPSSIDAQTIFSAFEKGMQVVGPEGERTPWLTFAKEMLPAVQDILSKVASMQKGTRQPPSVIQGGEPGREGTKAIEPPATGFLSLAPMIQPYLPTFIEAASSDDDPGLLAALVIKRIPIDKKQVAIDWFKSDKWFFDLASLDARIPAQKAWWEEFAKVIYAELTGEPVQDEEMR